MHTSATAAIVVYHGVLVDETEVIRFVLSRLPGLKAVTVGTAPRTFVGLGGVVSADATLVELGNPEIVAVPGGIGTHKCSEIANWLQTVSPAWILASSTGSALLAAAGLLRGTTAATHWLAGPLLERHGARPSREQVVAHDGIVTCSGCSSAFRAALLIADAYGGPDLVARIRADATTTGTTKHESHPAFWLRLWDPIRRSLHHEKHGQTRTTLDRPAVADDSAVTH